MNFPHCELLTEYPYTMLQKLSKSEVKAHNVEFQEFDCPPILREINFRKILTSKIGFFLQFRDV